MQFSLFVALSLALAASATPRYYGRAEFTLQNGQTALSQNQQFASLTTSSPCTSGQNACVDNQFAQCVNGRFVLTPCAGGLICAALPLVNSPGTSITCTTAADRDARIAATGATVPQRRAPPAGNGHAQRPKGGATPAGGPGAKAPAGKPASGKPPAAKAPPSKPPAAKPSAASPPPAAGKGGAGGQGAAASKGATASVPAASSVASTTTTSAANAAGTDSAGNNPASGAAAAAGGADPQTSLSLLPELVANGFAQDGQAESDAEAGQVPSLTSTNNFINFCATVPNLPITDGKQIVGGSCNPAPMGIIAAKTNMPSSKFIEPENLATIPAHTNFTVKMAITNLETGHFVNAATNYFAAPQVVNAQGNIQGHSHIVIDPLTSLKQTQPTDPTGFVYFKGLNTAAEGGVLEATVPGLPAGTYRLASINTAANHQPALVAVAQHGALDDMIYFTVQ
ncbi:hypothetical protein OH77DRAFT_236918 [Trametes cingulata]|nr:hypothetical protein OH77DRAFT_236918 [Trametes cingulata]